MDVFKITERYHDKKLYNIIDVVKEFPIYFNMTLEELEFYFNNSFIISKEEIITYLKKCNKDSNSLTIMEKEILLDYNYYQKVLNIFSTKALTYLSLIKYLSDCNNNQLKDEKIEKILENVEIFHYGSIVTGEDIKRLLVVLYHSIVKFNENLDEINEKTKFQTKRINPLFVLDEYGPSEKILITKEDYYIDKTSLITKKKTL